MKEYIWNKKNLPHKGWLNVGCEDLEVPSHTCEMCGKTDIRYVHTMYHSEVEDYYRVGCECAEHLTNDYVTAKKQLKIMKKKNSWINTNWQTEDYYEYEKKSFNSKYGRRMQVEIFKCNNGYALCIDDKLFNTIIQSKKQVKEIVYDSYVLQK